MADLTDPIPTTDQAVTFDVSRAAEPYWWWRYGPILERQEQEFFDVLFGVEAQ